MKRAILFLAAAFACVSMQGATARGGVVPTPPPGAARIANADAVIVGKVEALEPQDVKVGNATYRIAVVKINQGVRGIKDQKTLRIGFVPIEKPGNPMVIRTGARPVQLEAGQEGLFILTKQAKEDFYTIGGVIGYYINSNNNKGFDQEVATAKLVVRVLEKPLDALKGKDAEERLLAAAILIDKHRTFRGPKSTQEPIDAEESKLILQALADADWQAGANFSSLRPSPGQLFQRLGVTAKDGFTPAKGATYQTAAQNWLRENAQKYRIQRYVASDAK